MRMAIAVILASQGHHLGAALSPGYYSAADGLSGPGVSWWSGHTMPTLESSTVLAGRWMASDGTATMDGSHATQTFTFAPLQPSRFFRLRFRWVEAP